jgi:hypothetical protein
LAFARCQQMINQRGRGAFAIGAGDADDRCRTELKEQFDLRCNRRPGLFRGSNELVVRGYCRIDNHDVRSRKIEHLMFAKSVFNIGTFKLLEGFGQFLRLGQIRNQYFAAGLTGKQGTVLAPSKTS